MSITNSYNNPVVHNWNRDELGEPTLLVRENESKPVVGGKIALEEIPDPYRRVFIDGYMEIDLKQKIVDEFHYKVDYTNGIVFFHSSKEGQTINIIRYYGRGMFYIPSSRIWTKIATDGTIEETLKDVEGKLDIAKTLSDEIQQTENVRIQNENIRIQNEQQRQSDNTAFQVWENYDNLKDYIPLNKVQYQGSSYINIVSCKGILPTDVNYWQLIALKGADGLGTGDMLKNIYDINNNGIVDLAENSQKLEGKTLSEIYADIPEGTTVTDSTTNGNIVVNGSEIQVYDDIDIQNNINDLAGIGRTSETIKGNADKIGILNGTGEIQEKANKSLIGTLSDLTTLVKTSIVNAINSLRTEVDVHKDESVSKTGGVHGFEVEIGVFQPTLFGSTVAGSPVYAGQYGKFIRTGKRVKCFGHVLISAKGGLQGNVRIGGLPFTSEAFSGGIYVGNLGQFRGITYTQKQLNLQMNPNLNFAEIYQCGSGNEAAIKDTDIADVTRIAFEVEYFI